MSQVALLALVAVSTETVRNSVAYNVMSKSKTHKERAEKYAERIGKNLKSDILEPIERKIEDIEDKIFGLKDISLKTNINEGIRQVSQEQVQSNLAKVIELEYEKDLLIAEYNSKASAYNALFGSTSEVVANEQEEQE